MKRKPNILKIIAWLIIGFWLTRSLLFRLLHFDFTSHDIEENFRNIWLIMIPFAVGIFVVKSWKEKKPTFYRIVILGFLTILTFGLILILNVFSSICGRDYSEPLYKHKTKDIEIKYRELDCGATDGNPTIELVVTQNIGKYLIKYSTISKNDINEKEWIKQ